jgi:hypothetical protein
MVRFSSAVAMVGTLTYGQSALSVEQLTGQRQLGHQLKTENLPGIKRQAHIRVNRTINEEANERHQKDKNQKQLNAQPKNFPYTNP